MNRKKEAWTYSKQSGFPGHCFLAQVWDQDDKSICTINATKKESEANGHASLIAKSPEMLRQLEDNIKYLQLLATKHPESAPMIHGVIKDNMELITKDNKI